MPTQAEVRKARSAPRRQQLRTKPVPELWPSLGGEVCDFIEALCVHGPGDVRGQRVSLTDEERRFIWRAYEIGPKGHPREGRRRWRRAAYVRRKGVRKTEFSAWITTAELLGPVRFDGWDANGLPVARAITSPYIPVAATSLEQSEDTLWGAFYAIVTEGPLLDEFALDIALDRIMELNTGGEAKPVTSSSIARDGGKPTFEPRDETHLMILPELHRLNNTMLRNLPKRPMADPWALSTTTAWAPGQGSVAEGEAEEAAKQAAGLLPDNTILWDMRGASETWDLDDDEQLRQAIIEASGDALPWTDVDDIAGDFRRGTRAEGKRYWLSIPASVETDESWLKDHPTAFEECRVKDTKLDPKGSEVSVGVDSALKNDSCSVWALQTQPDGTVKGVTRTWVTEDGRHYDKASVRNYIRDLAKDLPVEGIGYDPRYFEESAQILEDEGLPMVVVDQTAQRMVPATSAAYSLIVDRTLRHDADEVATGQVLAAVPRETDGGWRLSKGKSKHKIDSAIGLSLAAYVMGHLEPAFDWALNVL